MITNLIKIQHENGVEIGETLSVLRKLNKTSSLACRVGQSNKI